VELFDPPKGPAKGAIMNHSFRFRNFTTTVLLSAAAAAGFGGLAAPPEADPPATSPMTAWWVAGTVGQRCSAPLDTDWRDWTRPRGVAIPR
jgi:hypothetical protein